MKNKNIKRITRIAVLSAIAYLLQMMGQLVPKISGFLEIELSELPALIAAFAMGPVAGVVVEFIKNLLHCFSGTTGLVGEFANFTINGIFVFTAGMIYKYSRTKKGALIAMLTSTIIMTVSAIVVNLFVMFPLYMPSAPFAAKLNLAISTVTPFNLCKGSIISLITYFCYKRIKPLLI